MPRLQRNPNGRHRSPASVVDVSAWHRIGLFGSLGIATIGLLASISTDELDRASFVYYVIATALTGVLWVLVHQLRPRWPLLAWPVMLLLGMLGASFAAPVAATLCMGAVVLGFLFAGLTQDRGVSLILLLPTVPTFIRVNHTVPAEQLIVRLGIALIVWSAVAELPAWLNDKLRSARADLERLAATDPLTGLANRRYWDAQLGRMLADHVPVAVLLVDLDHFKRFNDAHGHLAGDEMLIAFARVIEQVVPAGDVCARWGGEEFALALYDIDAAPQIAERIRRGVPLGQTCSIGLVVHRAGETLTDLMHRTDEALYRAKTAGRDRVVAA
ncbi:GGDEF domain-containing protein [Nocardioides sp. Iso805N]|uniref:GGDEF domain-containing protein n=1 Tax=Nocardioides sp. Iso805N TaxID=1283287 RepID=UPI00039D7046|nr:GGDEF domain-containing protein [Nocardioides sp. Iso805N]